MFDKHYESVTLYKLMVFSVVFYYQFWDFLQMLLNFNLKKKINAVAGIY